ncbi:unnamed protein product [Menidia menidia]|uniref:(Atlantic silverside) hypothetical protein n=1 Tax=Menidia menidia TaxID=238744 RepID=A0A8S4AEV1_9TELE|nr:unnamed protein product [Menidia menidia]
MDRSKCEKIISCFQARARGYLLRSEVRRARQDFEEIVKEIDGSLTDLRWTEAVIAIPCFTDIGPPCVRPFNKQSDSGLDVSPPQCSDDSGDRSALLKTKKAERDDSGDCLHKCPGKGDGEQQRQPTEADTDGGLMESIGGSSSVWSTLELDTKSYSHKGGQQYCLAKEVPCTPEALHLHRNTLTMELLWLQQAIDSRKKYLSLKDRLTVT